MPASSNIAAKLWSLCHILRDDGVSYQDYVTELTFLLFLKMLAERGDEFEQKLPRGSRWGDLNGRDGVDQLAFYRELLVKLGNEGDGRVLEIFQNAGTSIREPRILTKLVTDIDALDWYSVDKENLGDLYEDLLERNAAERKSGAGQYFTPRPLIDAMVAVMQPQPGELIQDPAAGTGGFLIAADRYIKERTDDLFDLSEKEQTFQRQEALHAVELVPDTHRLLLMNALLHGIDSPHLKLGDSLSPLGERLPPADLILTNPPFGTRTGGGRPTRDDFTFPTGNKQLAFLQHIYRGLKPRGRAAVVLPDNVLFEEGKGSEIRADLMDKCDLHTILRLPTGIFYAQGVKTNVLFFTRGRTPEHNTSAVWFYDLRTNMPSFGKRTPLTRDHFAEFEAAYGDQPDGSAARTDQGEEGRLRRYDRDAIRDRGDNLDITWLRDENAERAEDLDPPEEIAAQIQAKLAEAMAEMEELTVMLETTDV